MNIYSGNTSKTWLRVFDGYHADLPADSFPVSDVGTRHLTEKRARSDRRSSNVQVFLSTIRCEYLEGIVRLPDRAGRSSGTCRSNTLISCLPIRLLIQNNHNFTF